MAEQAAPLWRATLLCRCPRCGQGPLYRGILKLRDHCPVCGLDLRGADVGDGPVVPILMVLGAIVVGLALWVDATWEPPLWVHALLWPVVTIVLALAMMRPIKAFLVAQQFRTRKREMGV